MSLEERLKATIRETGPLTIADYVTYCLHDTQGGYYATRPAIGEDGDFITAPLVSQMFGELIGLWAVQLWIDLGAPARVILAEVGPGDGTLLGDALRAARVAAKFPAAAEVWLVEPSGPLRASQATRLARHGARWADSVDRLPSDAPLILIANEVLDCLGARQFQRTETGWAERLVGLDDAGALAFGLQPVDAPANPAVPVGAIVEHSPAQAAFAETVAAKIAEQGGAALLIDYGRTVPEPGDTLQALRRHAKVDPLDAPGASDLTQWAEFDVVAQAAEAAGAKAWPALEQGELLRRLGIETRAEALKRSRPDQAAIIDRQLMRLTAPDQMGALFKAVAITPAAAEPPPGWTA